MTINRRSFSLGLVSTLSLSGPAFSSTAKSGVPYPSLIGEIRKHTAKHEDTLLDLARSNGLGYVEIVAANPGTDPWLPGEGKEVVLPTAHLLPDGPRKGVLLNLTDQRLYFFLESGKIESFPVGTGREAWNTPLGQTKIVRKKKDPSWFVPESVRAEDPELPRVVRPGPDNPLGRHALYLGWPAYLIHGTNRPWGVGRRVSHGCIRMYPEDISNLFSRLPLGTPVTVINQEAKIGWFEDQLYLEVHPDGEQNLDIEATGTFKKKKISELAWRIKDKAGNALKQVDWELVREIEAKRSGIPHPILRDKKAASDS